ncbi:Protein of unknown function, partial [Gryllus bimaculatus]
MSRSFKVCAPDAQRAGPRRAPTPPPPPPPPPPRPAALEPRRVGRLGDAPSPRSAARMFRMWGYGGRDAGVCWPARRLQPSPPSLLSSEERLPVPPTQSQPPPPPPPPPRPPPSPCAGRCPCR